MKPSTLENKVIKGRKKATESVLFEDEVTKVIFPEEDVTPVTNDKKKRDTEELPFELLPRDIEVIEAIAQQDRVPYRFALQGVLRDALDLYHKFRKLSPR